MTKTRSIISETIIGKDEPLQPFRSAMTQDTEDVVARLAPSLGGDDLVMRLMYELHSHVPEEQRPLSMSDLSDEQAARARKAVHAVLTEWESARAALTDRQSLSDRIDVLTQALERAREALALGAEIPPMDVVNRAAVISLGERIGYGALMGTASVEWRSRLGELAGSEFCAGPCRSTAEKVIEQIDAALH